MLLMREARRAGWFFEKVIRAVAKLTTAEETGLGGNSVARALLLQHADRFVEAGSITGLPTNSCRSAVAVRCGRAHRIAR
ncbi:hypothetical protein RR48_10812 [Papilio machaon]|uniref:Uncharacterized protein n=1 Tax=Papilio machaon TaxID=76193 RepID=A0A194R733_PAPMA|nr:hypothetical protein RR48_10812 [Papilio machaon]